MLHITYRDNDGIITRREISDPEIVFRYDRTYIRAYCHLRDDERTFRANNIISMVRGDDGTALDPFTLRPFSAGRDSCHSTLSPSKLTSPRPMPAATARSALSGDVQLP